jgi:hypothetical protein
MYVAVLFNFINHHNNLSTYPFCCDNTVDNLYYHLVTIDKRCIISNLSGLINNNYIDIFTKKQLIKKCMKNNYIINDINNLQNYTNYLYMLGLNKNIEKYNI